jgi:hypothetical protein
MEIITVPPYDILPEPSITEMWLEQIYERMYDLLFAQSIIFAMALLFMVMWLTSKVWGAINTHLIQVWF